MSDKYASLRIERLVVNRLHPHAQKLKWSDNAFAEACVEAICDMIENPSTRTVPRMVLMVDAYSTPEKRLGANASVASQLADKAEKVTQKKQAARKKHAA